MTETYYSEAEAKARWGKRRKYSAIVDLITGTLIVGVLFQLAWRF